MPAAISFDKIADRYDELWTRSAAGSVQRQAVWRHIDALFVPGQRVLDLGCGTGEDAVHLLQRGICVEALDSSEQMVRIARERGVPASHTRIEDLFILDGAFDGAISNFGALNCVEDLDSVAWELARLIRLGGYFAACWIGRFCAWETAWYLAHKDLVKARRRWRHRSWSASFDMPVFYPSRSQIAHAFRGRFRLVGWYGIGMAVPPSYVSGISPSTMSLMSAVDRTCAHLPGFRALADHRLAIFERAS